MYLYEFPKLTHRVCYKPRTGDTAIFSRVLYQLSYLGGSPHVHVSF